MYLLDTNVVSELRKVKAGKADRNVAAWATSVPVLSLYISAVTVYELELGTLLLERKDPAQAAILRVWLDRHVIAGFRRRILPIDVEVAKRSSALHVPDPRPDRDAFIAATALLHDMSVVTRNVADFAPMGVPLVNPWDE